VSAADAVLARRCLASGALLMLLGVALGAFATHALQARLTPQRLASFQTGVLYQQLHALGLLLVGVLAGRRSSAALHWSARLMALGVLLFCGAIYLLTAGAPRWLGMVAPLGGLAMMAAWLALAAHALRGNGDDLPR
jgi:uncharacterized membrane protein YgdD (TMEM256/DUF423 family)